MSRRRKPVTAEGEKLILKPQQASQVLVSQQAAQEARERSIIVLDGVLAAAGIDGQVIGGDLGATPPFLLIRRK